MDSVVEICSNFNFLVFASCVMAYLISVRLYPVIIFLSQEKNLMDEPEERSMHLLKTPTLGGVGIFISFTLAIILFGIFTDLSQPDLVKLLSILAATIILLFLGVKDDLLVLSPRKKFSGQILASIIVVLATDMRIDSFYGIFGIESIPYIISVFFTVFVFIFIINAFNLVDGIDGLSGAVAIIASSSFGFFFLVNDQNLYALISFVLVGSTIGFLNYNLSKTKKLFMGDSGTLFVGFLLAYQAISFVALNELPTLNFTVSNAPLIAMSVLAYPILDTFRVFIIRIIQKRSPFSADRNHIHHRLLDLNLNHKQATSVIALGNVVVIAMTFLISGLYINVQVFIVMVVYPLIGLLPFFMVLDNGKYKIIIPKFRVG